MSQGESLARIGEISLKALKENLVAILDIVLRGMGQWIDSTLGRGM